MIRPDGSYQFRLAYDADSLVFGLPPGGVTPEDVDWFLAKPEPDRARRIEEVRQHLARTVRVRIDEKVVEPRILFPELGEGNDPGLKADVPLPGHTIVLEGPIPPAAQRLTFMASRLYGPIVYLFGEAGGEPTVRQVLAPGVESDPFRLDQVVRPVRRLAVAGRYLVLGFEHILPKGLDHILFVLALYLLSARLGPLLWQVTAFTVAHSVTLALAMYDVVALPPRIVEPLIAVSIAHIAVENLFTSELKPWRPAVVFAFGLLHGLGFAGVLKELGLPRREFLTALITFNVGVELGQVTVIALALAATGFLRRRAWYRRAIVMPASGGIALVGVYWAFTRAIRGL